MWCIIRTGSWRVWIHGNAGRGPATRLHGSEKRSLLVSMTLLQCPVLILLSTLSSWAPVCFSLKLYFFLFIKYLIFSFNTVALIISCCKIFVSMCKWLSSIGSDIFCKPKKNVTYIIYIRMPMNNILLYTYIFW